MTVMAANTNIGQMIEDLGSIISGVVSWVGTCVTALFGASGDWKELLGYVLLGVGVTIVLTGVHVIKSLTFGRG